MSLEKFLLRASAHFLIVLFVFLILSCIGCLYILEINPLSVYLFAIIFCYSEGCVFTLFQMDLIDIYRTTLPRATEYFFFCPQVHMWPRIDHILGHKSSLGKFKKIEIVSSIFFWSQCHKIRHQLQGGIKIKNLYKIQTHRG